MDFQQTRIQESIFSLDFDILHEYSNQHIRPYAPLLVNMLCSKRKSQDRKMKSIVKTIYHLCDKLEEFKCVMNYCELNFHDIKNDIVTINRALKKQFEIGDLNNLDTFLYTSIKTFVSQSSYKEKLIMIYKELRRIEINIKVVSGFIKSELFELNLFAEEINNGLCIIFLKFLDTNIISLPNICQTLLHIKHGDLLIKKLILNNSSMLIPLLKSIISCDFQNNDFVYNQIVSYVTKLTSLYPHIISEVISICMIHKIHPELIFKLSLEDIFLRNRDNIDQINLLISFLSITIDYGQDGKPKGWLYQNVKNNFKNPENKLSIFGPDFKKQISQLLQSILNDSTFYKHSHLLVPLSTFLKLYCMLKVSLNDKFNDDEAISILNLIMLKPELDIIGSYYISMAISLLFYCPSIISNYEYEFQIISWFKWILHEIDCTSSDCTSLKESILHIFLYLNGNQNSYLNDFISTKLGIKVSLRPNSYSTIKQIILHDIYNDDTCAKYLSTLPITKNLSANTFGFLPINSIINIFKTNKIISQKIYFKSWILNQIMNATIPLHTSLIKLIEGYVQIVLSSGKINESDERLFDQDEITRIMDCCSKPTHPTDNLVPQLLFLYYFLYFEDTLLNQKSPHFSPSTARELNFLTLVNKIPVKVVSLTSIQRHTDYAQLPALILLHLVNNHPYMCIVEDWIYGVRDARGTAFAFGFDKASITHVIADVINSSRDVEGLKLLAPALPNLEDGAVVRTVLHRILSHTDGAVFRSLDNYSPYPSLLKSLHDYWFYANTFSPSFDLMAHTLRSLASSPPVNGATLTDDVTSLALDPLVCLKLRPYTFVNPRLTAVALRMSIFCLTLSATYYTKYCNKNCGPPTPYPHPTTNGAPPLPRVNNGDRDRDEMVSTAILLQESAVVQILLEVCNARLWAGTAGLEARFYGREIRCLICSYLHQKFIDDGKLGRLVHFQGYPLSLTQTVASDVPSAHICIDLVPDLVLRDTRVETKIFGIYVASYLSHYYTMPKFMDSCRLCLRVVLTFMSPANASLMTSHQLTAFLYCVTPALYVVCHSFPTLLEECVRILVEIGKISRQISLARPGSHGRGGRESSYYESRESREFLEYVEEQRSFFSRYMSGSEEWQSDPGTEDVGENRLFHMVKRTFLNIVKDFCLI